MFQHFHAHDNIKTARLLSRESLGTHFQVFNVGGLCFQCVQLRYFERLGGQVDAEYAGTFACH